MIDRLKFAKLFTALMLSRLQVNITDELIGVWYDGIKNFDEKVVEKTLVYFTNNGGHFIDLPQVKEYARSIFPGRFMIPERTQLTDEEKENNKRRISELVDMICNGKPKEDK